MDFLRDELGLQDMQACWQGCAAAHTPAASFAAMHGAHSPLHVSAIQVGLIL